MFGSKLNASHIPFNLNFTVENFLLAGDAGSLTQILCSLMNYFVSDLGLIPAQLTVEEAPALFFFLSLSFFFFKWACVWSFWDMMPYSAPLPKTLWVHVPTAVLIFWGLWDQQKFRTQQPVWLLTDIRNMPQVFAYAQHAYTPPLLIRMIGCFI